jgi:adenylyltransferase/sulfurtransferase
MNPFESPPSEIEVQQVKAMLDKDQEFLLLDCRERDEYELVHLNQAKLVPMSELMVRVGELEPYRDQNVVVFCHAGMRSQRVVHWLRQQGFDHAQSMSGGIDAWSTEIDPSLPRY